MAAEEQRRLQTKLGQMEAYLRHHTERATVAGHSCRLLRNFVAELRHQTTAQLQALQEELESYKTQISQFTQHSNTDTTEIAELVKLEAFELWVHKCSEAETQITAPNLLQRVTTKVNHTLRILKAELQQATTERDDLQGRLEQQEKENRGRNGTYQRRNMNNTTTLSGYGRTTVEPTPQHSTNTSSGIALQTRELTTIFNQFTQTNQKLKVWIT